MGLALVSLATNDYRCRFHRIRTKLTSDLNEVSHRIFATSTKSDREPTFRDFHQQTHSICMMIDLPSLMTVEAMEALKRQN
jgi:hypothetical protein